MANPDSPGNDHLAMTTTTETVMAVVLLICEHTYFTSITSTTGTPPQASTENSQLGCSWFRLVVEATKTTPPPHPFSGTIWVSWC